MSSSDLIRWGGLAAMVAGVVWVVSGILAVVYQGEHAPGTFADYLVEGTFAAGLLLTVVGMVGLHALQKENYGRIGRAGFYTVIAAASVQIVAQVGLMLGSTAVEFLDFLGLLGLMVGFVLYGAATLQARVLPRWCGVGFIVGLPVWWVVSVVLGNEFGGSLGGTIFGFLWLGLGYVLWSRRGTANDQPARVR